MDYYEKIKSESAFDSSNLKKVNDKYYINKNDELKRYKLFHIHNDGHIVHDTISFEEVEMILNFDNL